MKLNLLPTYVSKGKQSVVALVFAAVIVVVSILATLGMISQSGRDLKAEKDRAESKKQYAENAVALSKYADTVIDNAQGVILNAMLAEAMLKHNSAYPDFYDRVMPYVPSFFRVTSMTATPLDADNAALTLTGVIQTQDQYRDLMLALNRIPQVRTVARTGYEIVEQYVPRLIEVDQTGRPIRRNETNIPDDPLARLDYLMAKGGLSGFTGAGGFGTGEPGMKGAMPNWSVITVTVVLPGKLQTPNPRATLSGGGGSSTAGGGSTGGAPAFGGGGGTGAPGGAGAPGAPAGPGGMRTGGPAASGAGAPGGGAGSPSSAAAE